MTLEFLSFVSHSLLSSHGKSYFFPHQQWYSGVQVWSSPNLPWELFSPPKALTRRRGYKQVGWFFLLTVITSLPSFHTSAGRSFVSPTPNVSPLSCLMCLCGNSKGNQSSAESCDAFWKDLCVTCCLCDSRSSRSVSRSSVVFQTTYIEF